MSLISPTIMSASAAENGPVVGTPTPPPSSGHKVNPAVPLAIVLGLIFGLLIIIGLLIFFLRAYFIRRRSYNEKPTISPPARARLANANLFWPRSSAESSSTTPHYHKRSDTIKRDASGRPQISKPINFEHLERGVLAEDDTWPKGIGIGIVRPAPAPTASSSTFERDDSVELGRSNSDRIKQKFEDLLTLESGLGSHMETMKNSRQPTTQAVRF